MRRLRGKRPPRYMDRPTGGASFKVETVDGRSEEGSTTGDRLRGGVPKEYICSPSSKAVGGSDKYFSPIIK